jgi:GNAT superfamily N-acetyltransferase
MEIELRESTVDDAPSLAALSSQLGYVTTAAEIRSRLYSIQNSEQDVVYVAVVGNVIVGWVHGFCTLRLESGWFSEVGGIVVDENYRSNSVGKMMLDKLKQWSLGKGMAALRVRVKKERTEAHNFYLKQGFTKTKDQMVYDAALAGNVSLP